MEEIKRIIYKYSFKLEHASKHRNVTLTSKEVDELLVAYAQVHPSGARQFSKGCAVCVFDMVDILTNRLHILEQDDRDRELAEQLTEQKTEEKPEQLISETEQEKAAEKKPAKPRSRPKAKPRPKAAKKP